MSDASIPTRFAARDFSVGRVLNRTFSVLTGHFLTFFTVTAVASLPTVLLSESSTFWTSENPTFATGVPSGEAIGLLFLGIFATVVLYTLSQAIVLYGAFQDMRGRPVSLVESLQVGLRRVLPIIGLAIATSFLAGLATLFFIVPGLILFTMWFVATPACVVEQLGPFRSMGRSRRLTKGHRWRIFGLILLLVLISAMVSPTLGVVLGTTGSRIVVMVGSLIWSGIWGAFYAIAAVVAYHDLRAAKEGIDIEQIAAVFD